MIKGGEKMKTRAKVSQLAESKVTLTIKIPLKGKNRVSRRSKAKKHHSFGIN